MSDMFLTTKIYLATLESNDGRFSDSYVFSDLDLLNDTLRSQGIEVDDLLDFDFDSDVENQFDTNIPNVYLIIEVKTLDEENADFTLFSYDDEDLDYYEENDEEENDEEDNEREEDYDDSYQEDQDLNFSEDDETIN